VAHATKKGTAVADWISEEYRRAQLTPEQKAAARAELNKLSEEAKRNGVYEGLLSLFGKVHLTYDMDDLREDRD